jgi:hypothetical protein
MLSVESIGEAAAVAVAVVVGVAKVPEKAALEWVGSFPCLMKARHSKE